MKKLVKNFERQELFDLYHARENPFIILTTKIDITNLYKKCEHYYASLGYFITLAVNEIDNFKYRYEDGKMYKYDRINPSYTDMFKNGKIGFFRCEFNENYSDFINEFLEIKKHFLETSNSTPVIDQAEIWFSCTPWFNFSGLVPPFDKNITVPQFIWDKFTLENGRCYTNLMIMIHHGFADGYHINLFLEKLQDIMENIEKYVS